VILSDDAITGEGWQEFRRRAVTKDPAVLTSVWVQVDLSRCLMCEVSRGSRRPVQRLRTKIVEFVRRGTPKGEAS
jgi:hypothetical protein